MATMLPQAEPRSSASYDYPASSPPEANMMHPAGMHPGPGDALSEYTVPFQTHLDFGKMAPPGGFVNGSEGMPVPVPNAPPPPSHMPNGGPRHGQTMSLGGFEGSRSPPAAKNTSHVPCKFYRLGQCQAGRACPFSHSTDITSVDTPCKYFAKGNCKFGQKCALAHILPNGRRVNRPSIGGGGAVTAPRIDPQLYQQSDPALIQSLLTQQVNGMAGPFNHQIPAIPSFVQSEAVMQGGYMPRAFEQIPPKDSGSASRPDSKFGSPREDSRFLSLSPSAHLSVLDAPLPASFDSQGISYMARHGPVAASLPSKIGLLESSPPASLPKKAPIPLDSVSNLGSLGFTGREVRTRGADLGSSPFGSGDEGGLGPRFMHSRRQPKAKLLSKSMPRVDIPIEDSDDDAFHFSGGEEDYIPTSIHDQVFTRDERQRRYSRTENDRRNARDSLSGIDTPNDSSSKVGSPTTGSPSRYGPLFARQQQENGTTSSATIMATSPSAFGHVGSPLRNSSLHLNSNTSPSRGNQGPGSGELSPSFPSLSSPPRQSSMSVLSQQLSRTRLSTKAAANAAANEATTGNSSSNHAYTHSLPSGATNPSSSTSYALYPPSQHQQLTSPSNRANADRIVEEEHVDGVFSMEDDFEDANAAAVLQQQQQQQRERERRRNNGSLSGSAISGVPAALAWNQVAAAAGSNTAAHNSHNGTSNKTNGTYAAAGPPTTRNTTGPASGGGKIGTIGSNRRVSGTVTGGSGD